MKVTVTEEIRQVCPAFVGACIEATVENSAHSDGLWREIDALSQSCRALLTTEKIKEMPSIAATRRIYRACGKDPSRYRPSAEALLRRVLQGKALYQIDTVVDLINLASMSSGYSIGAFDASKFVGEELQLGIGRDGEPYEGIGRGTINIAGLPVYRDAMGGVGTPTSDHERTKVDATTRSLLVLVNGYDGDTRHVVDTAEHILRLLADYCSAQSGRYEIFS